MFRKFVPEEGAPTVGGLVVIFDSADGGIIGATLADVEEMADGKLAVRMSGSDVTWMRRKHFSRPPNRNHRALLALPGPFTLHYTRIDGRWIACL